MKTIMKPAAILVTIAVLTAVLTALSCKPVVEITKRDWKAVNADKDTSLLSVGSTAYVPEITASLNKDNTVTDYNIVSIKFPKKADILQKKNAEIGNALKEFMEFYTYDKSDSTAKKDPLVTKITYTFETRVGETIKVKLSSVPDKRNLVGYIIASKYTFANGRKLGDAGDTKYGTAYYDEYTTLKVTGADVPAEHSADYASPYKRDWVLTINKPGGTPDSDTHKVTTEVATLTLSGGGDDQGKWRKDTLSGLVKNFKLQQFENGSWSYVKEANFKYQDDSGKIAVEFTTKEFVPYVVEASGLENMEAAGTQWGVKQRIKVKGDREATASFSLKKVTTDPTLYNWNLTDRTLATYAANGSPVSSGEILNHDKNGKNLVIKLTFDPITAPGGTDAVYLKEMALADLKKYLKIGYRIDGEELTVNSPSLLESEKIAFLDIVSRTYGSNLTPASNKNQLTLTLNSTYSLLEVSNLYLFIAKGFEYTNGKIIFGDQTNWQYKIGGVSFFDFYGEIPLEGVILKPKDISLSLGTTYSGSLTAGAASKTHTITLLAGDYLVTWTGNITVSVQEQDAASWLTEDNDDGIYLVSTSAGKQAYVIQVDGSPGSYTLLVKTQPVEELDLEAEEKAEGSLSAGDIHKYTVALTEGTWYVLWEGDVDLEVRVTKDGETPDPDGWDDTGLFEFEVDEDNEGDYIIEVRAVDITDEGDYVIVVTDDEDFDLDA